MIRRETYFIFTIIYTFFGQVTVSTFNGKKSDGGEKIGICVHQAKKKIRKLRAK